MATIHSSSLAEAPASHSLDVLRMAVATGVSAAVIYVLCWVGTFIPFSSPTHAYISLFTSAYISSGLALVEGACWSLLFGLLVGVVFALIYNATAAIGRK